MNNPEAPNPSESVERIPPVPATALELHIAADILSKSELENEYTLKIIEDCVDGTYGSDFLLALGHITAAYDTLKTITEVVNDQLNASQQAIMDVYMDNMHIDVSNLNAYIRERPGILVATIDNKGEDVIEIAAVEELLAEGELPQIGFVMDGTVRRNAYNVQCIVESMKPEEQALMQEMMRDY